MSSTHQSVILAKRPGKGPIIAGETLSLQTQTTPRGEDLNEGQFIIKTLYLSLDPAMRGWMNDVRSNIPPVAIGGMMRGAVIGEVASSKSLSFTKGQYVYAPTGMTEYALVDDSMPGILNLGHGGGSTILDSMGVLGPTGLTAYFGTLEIAAVKPGDFVVVSGAAGATGSVVGQIAKILGAKVLGIAGSDEKVRWLKDLGFDDALNYNDPDMITKFNLATENLIDVFFDNVGGAILELALSRAKPHSRFVICGGVSQYNVEEPQGPKNFLMIVRMRIRVQGFIIFDYEDRFPEARKQLSQWLDQGKLRSRITIMRGGLDVVEQGLLDLYNGGNTGKLIVEVCTDSGIEG